MKLINVSSEIKKLLKKYGGDKNKVAELLDCSLRYVYDMEEGRKVRSTYLILIKTRLMQ